MSPEKPSFDTLCAHAGTSRNAPAIDNLPFVPPVVQSTIFQLGDSAQAEAIFSGTLPGYTYSRFGNPTVDTLAATLARLEGGAGACITASGNAAVLCAVTIALAGRSGPLVTHQDIYGGSFELLRILHEVHHVPVEWVDARDEAAWIAAVGRAGAVLLETPSNPLLRLIDVAATAAAAQPVCAPVIVDNTVATPFNQRPLALGADWVVHSTTKYLNGHSDMIGGALIGREPLSDLARRIHKNLGGTVNAFDAWLVLRGLRTFALRMAAHNRNGAAVAAWLAGHPAVTRVHYAGLPAHPQHDLARRQMQHGGALLSFELAGGEVAARRFVDRLHLIVHAVSLGGLESLVTRPAMSSHRGMSPTDRARAGVSDALIRLSVGVEAEADLLADLDQALAGL
ncbi:trans-sulfuration enzyme family protein [Actomonas aquatica]|uniref:Aminotransferase class I/II-fold pyridoxal phosphate-dependent enzyme n=1 Tax=Actomonas aquatica TaxID=2866162 RepID=A0ABZ1C5B8_9BACT|nr:aminotransferase class I/II-fold pyridoxal phosphate-dependent enzyme [Opitutus sp. WL0086]WRQ86538.1 aminotransferase class I/II-fold pyridoxal phosphate-dependent enzyme [Opitutus sp. WL0086]